MFVRIGIVNMMLIENHAVLKQPNNAYIQQNVCDASSLTLLVVILGIQRNYQCFESIGVTCWSKRVKCSLESDSNFKGGSNSHIQ